MPPDGERAHARGRPAGQAGRNLEFLVGLARAFAGAIIFSLPLVMTMEMWWLGLYLDRLRLALLLVLLMPLLVRLSSYVGFERTSSLTDDAVDACAAFAVGFVASGLTLTALGVLRPGMSFQSHLGVIAVQAVPASFGAMLAQAQLGRREDEKVRQAHIGYGGELFLMAAGALFLAFNVAPTEEMILIASKMTEWHAVALVLASVVLMHAFVFRVGFRGQEEALPPGTPQWSALLRFTLVGYAIALLVSAYVLWTFGRWDGLAWPQRVVTASVLGFPAAIGAAAARLIL